MPKHERKKKTKSGSKFTVVTVPSKAIVPLASLHGEHGDIESLVMQLSKRISLHAKSSLGSFELVEPKEEKREDEQVNPLKLVMRMVFKADRPYRCRSALHGVFASSAGGTIASSVTVSQVTSVQEWSSLAVLFDEVFVHSMTFHFFPPNSAAQNRPSSSGGVTALTAGTASTVVTEDVFLIVAAYFSDLTAPSTAVAMEPNPNRVYRSMVKPWSYAWRNNVRFDKHGISFDPTATGGTISWQGWINVSAAAKLGGLIAIRAVNDTAVGTGSTAVTVGQYALNFDLSFRSRA